MREILFRGKRLDNGEWVEGYLLKTDGGTYIMYPGQFDDDLFISPKNIIHAVDPSTVGQFSGLTDKNGKRIFEGDVVSTDLERPYLIVEFRDGCFMFNVNDGGEDYYDIMVPILREPQTVYKYGEVIGNIHDNKELLHDSQV